MHNEKVCFCLAEKIEERMFTDNLDDLIALDGEIITGFYPGQKPLFGSKGNKTIQCFLQVP